MLVSPARCLMRASLGRKKREESSGEQHTLFRLTISPLAFLTFFSFIRKYQKRDLATTSLGAKMRMR